MSEYEDYKSVALNSSAPNFQAKTTHGDIDFHKFLDNKWTILFSHPADFTPVCTTELGAFAKLKNEFDARGVQMIGLVRPPDTQSGRTQTDSNPRAPTTLPRTANGSTISTK
jgi:peroxiredoxin